MYFFLFGTFLYQLGRYSDSYETTILQKLTKDYADR